MPAAYDDEDDDNYDSEACAHCECWSDGGDCCDCGMENDNWDGDEDDGESNDPILGSSVYPDSMFQDDGTDEVGD